MTFSALRRPLSALVALATALVVPVLATGPSPAQAEPAPVATAMRTFGFAAASPASAAPGARALSATDALSPTVDLGGRAHVVGVTWSRGAVDADATVELRERRDGRWGAWQTLDTDPAEGPDAGTEDARRARAGTAPWVTTADTVQARVVGDTTGAGRGARFDVVDATTTAGDRSVTSEAAGGASAAATRPTILTRKDWGADESIRHAKVYEGEIKTAIVHHTAGSNDYTSSEVPSIIRGIYVFHTNGRDWGDIGYNFVVDRFGRTWEGRYGGVTRPMVGAHALGYNSQSFGVSVIGDFSTATPPSAVPTAISRLVAWKLGIERIDPRASTTLDGYGTAPTVIGHRDVNETSCPGARLYSELPDIRSRAKALQGTMLYGPAITRTAYSYGGGGATVTAKASTLLRWSLSVTSVCHRTADVVLTGSASERTPVRAAWDGRLADGSLAPPGDYRVSLSASTGNTALATALTSAWTVRIGATAGSPAGFCPPRLAAGDRFGVAVAAARANDDTSTRVVLVNGQEAAMADALVAAPLAEHEDAVLLLTNASGLPGATAAEITRRKVTSVTIVGGGASVSSTVVNQLRDRGVGSITRVSGADRYEVAANVADRLGVSGGAPDVLVASGRPEAMADGLILSGPATALRRPILLVAEDAVPEATKAALTRLGTRRTVVAGGPATVPAAVLSALPSPTRLGGADRYEVSSVVATWARGAGVATDSVLVASGRPTALADTLAGGQLGRPTLYVTRDRVPPSPAAWLQREAALRTVTVLGGTASVSLLVGGDVRAALG